jgi:hypothetical protein
VKAVPRVVWYLPAAARAAVWACMFGDASPASANRPAATTHWSVAVAQHILRVFDPICGLLCDRELVPGDRFVQTLVGLAYKTRKMSAIAESVLAPPATECAPTAAAADSGVSRPAKAASSRKASKGMADGELRTPKLRVFPPARPRPRAGSAPLRWPCAVQRAQTKLTRAPALGAASRGVLGVLILLPAAGIGNAVAPTMMPAVLFAGAEGEELVRCAPGCFMFEDPQGKRAAMRVFYYLPASYQYDTPVLFVCHGIKRNAEEYLGNWIRLGLAEKHNVPPRSAPPRTPARTPHVRG